MATWQIITAIIIALIAAVIILLVIISALMVLAGTKDRTISCIIMVNINITPNNSLQEALLFESKDRNQSS